MAELDGSQTASYDASLGDLLTQLFSPLQPADFVAGFLAPGAAEPRPLVIRRARAGHFAGMVGLEVVERVVTMGASTRAAERRPPRNHVDISLLIRLLQGGEYRTGKYGAPDAALTVGEVRAKFSDGFTVLINDVDQRDARVAALCEALEALVRLPVNANVYLSGAETHGFETHFDSMDVLVLQLEGAKEWTVYEPFLALPDAERKFAPPSALLRSLPSTRVLLRAGDVLYLPRGYAHEAAAQRGEPPHSMHLTLGLLAKDATWAGLVHELLDLCATANDATEASCPAGARAAVAGKPARAATGGLSWAQLLHAAVSAVTWSREGNALALRQLLPMHAADWERERTTAEALGAALQLVATAPVELSSSAFAWSEAAASSEAGRSDPHILRPRAAWRAAALTELQLSALDGEMRARVAALAGAAAAIAPLAAASMARKHSERAEAMSPNFGADDDADLQAALLASMTEMSPAADMDFSTLNPSSPLFAQFERPPLVANPEPIEPWAATQIRTRDEAVQALRRLSECGTLLVRIRGDGHCLFRALAAGLVLAVREMEPARARSVGAWLHPRLARAPPATSSNLNDANLAGSVTSASGAALDLLGALHEGTLPSIASEAIFAGLAEQQSSDELVIAMRRAACGHLARHAGRFRECEAALGVSFETYLGDMAELHPTDGAPRYGSALEVVALAELLECVIDIYDCDTLKVVALAGRDCAPDVPPSYRFFPERDDTPGDEWRGESAGEGSAPSMDGALQSWVLVDPPSELPDALERVAEPSPLRRTGLALLRTGLHYHLLHPIGCNFESEIGRVGER